MGSLFAPRGVSKLSRLKIREISLVDAPANQHSMVLLAKSKNGANTTIRLRPIAKAYASGNNDEQTGVDMRSDAQKAADLETVCALALAKRPLVTEDYYSWTRRVFGETGAAQLFADQDYVLRRIFETLKRHIEIRKRADDALAAIAKGLQAADPKLSFAQAFTKAANTADGKRLYDAGRGNVRVEDEPDDEEDDADDSDPEAAIEKRAEELQTEQPDLSRFQAYARAAVENPGAYKRLRQRAIRGT
jgi:hypothetical protein